MSQTELDLAPSVIKAPPIKGMGKMMDVGNDEENRGSGTFDSGIGDESILDRLTNLKLSSSEDSNNNQWEKESKKMGSTTSAGGHGDDGKTGTENSVTTAATATTVDRDVTADGAADNEKESEKADVKENDNSVVGVVSTNEENSKNSKPPPPTSPKGSQSPQSRGRMSPAEFFQTSRLRCSGLAHKLNTTHVFGGSIDQSHSEENGSQSTEEVVTTTSPVDEITKGIENVGLDDEKKKAKKKLGQSKSNDDSFKKTTDHHDGEETSTKRDTSKDDDELIQRSPVPGYTANRNVQHPYHQAQKYNNNNQASPSRGYYQMKVEDVASYSPAYYMEQQRHKAGHQHPGFCPSRVAAYPHPQQQQQLHYQPPSQAVPSPTAYYDYGAYSNTAWTPPNPYYQQQQQQQAPPSSLPPLQQLQQCAAAAPIPVQQQLAPNQPLNVQQQPIAGNFIDPFDDISPPASVINSLADMCRMTQSPLAVLSPFTLSPMQPTDGGAADEKPTVTDTPSASCELAARELAIEELPDELCDFILTYSRQYTGKSDMELSSGNKTNPGSVRTTNSDEHDHQSTNHRATPGTPGTVSSRSGGGYETGSTDARSPGSSVGDQQLFSPGSTFYTNSPNAYSPRDGKEQQQHSPCAQMEKTAAATGSNARNRLREQINQKDLDAALAWAMRCCQSRPEALFFRDKDGDSLLHIVIWHKDLAKIYVLTEIILKSTPNNQTSAPKLFDLPNKQNETPLFLAVEKGLNDVVAYLLECGADASVCPKYGDADPPLHYAAARGMADIVHTLCNAGRGGINVLNGVGMTPLICAAKNHGNLDGESQTMVDNAVVIKTLLKAGADAGIQDASSGKSVLHYCVDRMDPSLIQLFGDNLDRNTMARLVNSVDYNGFTPLALANSPSMAHGGGGSESSALDEEKMRQKVSKLLLEYSVSQNLSADDFGDLSSFLISDQISADGFTMLDEYLSSSAY